MVSSRLRLVIPDPMLLPDRETPYLLHSAYELMDQGFREQIVLDWRDSHLVVQVNGDFDTLEPQFYKAPFRRTKAYHSIGSNSFWEKLLGKECDWTWVGVSRQGYCDIIVLSFDSILPQVLFHAIGSSIEVFTISEGLKGRRRVNGKPSRKTTKA